MPINGAQLRHLLLIVAAFEGDYGEPIMWEGPSAVRNGDAVLTSK